MLRRTEPVVSLVPRFTRRVQPKRAADSPSWTRRFARKSVDAAIASSRSAPRAIAATPIARRRVARPRGAIPFGPLVRAIGAVLRAASIIVIISARIAPA
jgi:hypothetical protein